MDYFITFWKFIFISLHIGVWCQPLSSEDKTYLVDYLNAKRSAVGASDMYAIQWDESIGTEAQNHVGNINGACTTGPDEANWYFSQRSPSIGTLKEHMEGWYNGTEVYDYASNTCTGGEEYKCNIYKQWVNAQAYKLGCGRGICGDFIFFLCYIGPSTVWKRKPFKLITNDQPACSLCHGDCVNGMCTHVDVCKPRGVTISGADVKSEVNGVYNLGFCADNSISECGHPQYIKDNYWYLFYECEVGRWVIGTLGEDNKKNLLATYSTMDFPYYSFCETKNSWKFLINKGEVPDPGLTVTSCGGAPEGTCTKMWGEEGTPCEGETACDYRNQDWKSNCGTPEQPNGGSPGSSSGDKSDDPSGNPGPDNDPDDSSDSFSNSVGVYSIMYTILYLSCLF